MIGISCSELCATALDRPSFLWYVIHLPIIIIPWVGSQGEAALNVL